MREIRRRLLVALTCSLLLTTAGSAGTLAGSVLNGMTGQPVPGASVQIEGTELTGRTGPDGTLQVRDVPAGTYTAIVTKNEFQTEHVSVEIPATGAANFAAVIMPQEGTAAAEEEVAFGEEITVAAAAESTEAAVLTERKNAAQISDSIGIEEIGKTTGSDAAGVLKRVTGVSIQEDKFVYVRGLGDRYSNTTLNGSKVPSTEFEKKVVPLNLFPTGLLDKISVSKSYTVDKPGDFAAGFVDLRTLEFPPQQTFSVGLSAGYDSMTTGDPFLEYGDGLDFGGDGGQALPASVPAEPIFPVTPRNPDGFTSQEIEQFGEALVGTWNPSVDSSAPYDQGFELSYGNTVGRLGIVLSAGYENDFATRLEEQNVFSLSGGELVPLNTFDLDISEETVRQSLLGNFAFRVSDNSNIKLRTLYTDLSNTEARLQEGFFDDLNTNLRDQRVSFLNQQIFNAQLAGEHFLAGAFPNGSLLEWRASTTDAETVENRREAIYEERSSGGFFLTDFGQSGFMYFNDLKDSLTDGGFDWATFLGGDRLQGSVKLGGSYTHNERDFDGRRLRFDHRNTFGVDLTLSPEELFTEENIGTAFTLQEITRPTDAYDGDQEVTAGYGQVDLAWNRWRFIGGARFEDSTIEVLTVNRANPDAPPELTVVDDRDVLPALNVVYSLTSQTNLRAAFSQTVNRPEFRELAPFSFVHVVGGFEVIGNPDLESATIRSYDLRWEWFPNAGEVVATSLFYKDFERPIESIQLAGAQQFHTFTNAQGAENFGAEIEFRRNLGSFWEGWDPFTVILNYTYVESEIQIDPDETALALTNPTHPLTGQPDDVGNLTLEWNRPEWGSGARLLYNYVGDKLYAGGTLGVPDVYEEARSTVDFVWSQNLGFAGGLVLKLSGRNLTNEEHLWTQGSGVFRAYEPGRSYGLSLTYRPF